MSQLTMIYSPDGEPFEVPHHKVGELVLNKGWSQQRPEIVPVDEIVEDEVIDADELEVAGIHDEPAEDDTGVQDEEDERER